MRPNKGDTHASRRSPPPRHLISFARFPVCFEELGDEDAMLAVDLALRDAAGEFEESPRSFQSGYRRSSVPPPRLG